MLKKKMPEKPYEIRYRFGFSSPLSDLGNPEKLVTDILCKKYHFDDRDIFKIILEKEIVAKGKEFIEFEILSYK
jgi:Holliday junction resolvase RusA-like endonuclease